MKKISTDIVRINDALKFISDIEASYEQKLNRLQIMGICYGILVVGEALNHVSQETRMHFPEIEWRKIIDTRNLLTHGYGHVDEALLIRITEHHLPILKAQLINVLKHLQHKAST